MFSILTSRVDLAARRCGRILLWVCVAAVLAVGLGAGPAAADTPASPSTATAADSSGGQTLPKGMPAELRKFIGGSPEFKKGPWFSGPCAAKGGDFSAYLNAMFPVENKLRYWVLDPDDKKKFLKAAAAGIGARTQMASLPSQSGPQRPTGDATKLPDGTAITIGNNGIDDDTAAKMVDQGWVPPETWYTSQFPGSDSSAYPAPAGVCAGNLARWSGKALNTWGFQWADKPDDASLAAMRKIDDNARYTDPCGSNTRGASSYCEHAYFLDCSQVTDRTDQTDCQGWNLGVARMFKATRSWIDSNTTFADRLDNTLNDVWAGTPVYQQYRAGKAVVDAWNKAWALGKKVVDFVSGNPDFIDQWANKAKKSAVDLISKTIPGLASIGDFDITSEWFLKWYAVSTGIGIFVMALMALLAARKAAAKSLPPREVLGNFLGSLPLGLMLMTFAPGAASMIMDLAHTLTDSLAQMVGSSTNDTVNNVSAALGNLTDKTLVGGVITGLIVFVLLIIAGLGLLFGLLAHMFALPLLACAAGLGYGMLVHDQWRAKALRPTLMFLGVVLSKPLLFLMLGAGFGLINFAAKNTAQVGSGVLQPLLSALLMIVVFGMIGLAPFALVKYAPLLPTAADSESFGGQSAFGGVVGGASNAAMMMAGRGGNSVGHAGTHNAATGGGGGGAPMSGGGRHSSGGRTTTGAATAAAHTGGGTPGAASSSKPGVHGSAKSEHGKGAVAGIASRLGSSKLAGAGVIAAPETAGAAMAVTTALAATGAAVNKASSAAQSGPPTPDRS